MRLALLIWLSLITTSELRTWTDSSGKYRTEAELVEARGGVAYLKRDGKVKPIPIAKLSTEDQRYVQTFYPAKGMSGKVVAVFNGDTFALVERWINREQVTEGWSWHATNDGNSEILSLAEAEAGKAERGLWADATSVSTAMAWMPQYRALSTHAGGEVVEVP
jgi:hypothetical protein